MAGVRDKLAVVYKICCSCIVQRLIDQEGQLEIDSLSDRKPEELSQHWCDVVTSTSTGDESRCRESILCQTGLTAVILASKG